MCLKMCSELLTIVYNIIYICLLECLECLFFPYDKNGFSTLTHGNKSAAHKLEGF